MGRKSKLAMKLERQDKLIQQYVQEKVESEFRLFDGEVDECLSSITWDMKSVFRPYNDGDIRLIATTLFRNLTFNVFERLNTELHNIIVEVLDPFFHNRVVRTYQSEPIHSGISDRRLIHLAEADLSHNMSCILFDVQKIEQEAKEFCLQFIQSGGNIEDTKKWKEYQTRQ